MDAFKQSITPKTKAVIIVDLYGGMPEIDKICAIAKQNGISVIEDAAEALGSEYKNKKAGSFGHTGVFSFHGSKTLTTGEGGMLVTDIEDIYKRCLFLRDHGRKPEDKMFWNTEVAYKYKMSSMQAALGLAQLERVEELIRQKREIFSWYKQELVELKEVTLNYEDVNIKNSYWMVTVIFNEKIKINKEKVIELMSQENIDTRPFFYPLSSLPAYQDLKEAHEAQQKNTISYKISPNGVNLPCGLNMTQEKIKYVCDILTVILKRRG